ncbi:HPP family protein [Marinimicrobium agarilyticum]|uniref:HPP family protein n=1 Tax=Marinimicrobium agarilyticum TaxID=306546 RepID=UPI000408A1B0|nr:HPP family protein [Marinimicrobium agarilyticum]
MILSTFWQTFRAYLGVERNTTSHAEKCLSAVGAFLGILSVCGISFWYLSDTGALLMLASMGASAVLLFAVPHGALSQPWALLGGHLLSAAVGVSCQRLWPDAALTPALAVGLAVGLMYYLRCIHPPGGATALAAVIGGASVHELGYQYLITPVLWNSLALLAVAVLFNSVFPWRRYPAHWGHRSARRAQMKAPATPVVLSQEDLSAAMSQLNSYVDITTEELVELMQLAREHAERQVEHPQRIEAGRFYSNGELGHRWCVRQVIDAANLNEQRRDQVIYKNVAGENAYETGICQREAFRQWARFEVVESDGRWVKLGGN